MTLDNGSTSAPVVFADLEGKSAKNGIPPAHPAEKGCYLRYFLHFLLRTGTVPGRVQGISHLRPEA